MERWILAPSKVSHFARENKRADLCVQASGIGGVKVARATR